MIYTPHAMPTLVKFLYCPKCKDLRPKAWFAISDTCIRCLGPARRIPIPATPLTFTKYALWILVIALVAVHLAVNDRIYLWAAVIGLVAAMILAYIDLQRGEKTAKAKIRVTSGDHDLFDKHRRV
jgi:membrane associated rhomboid family serine protease